MRVAQRKPIFVTSSHKLKKRTRSTPCQRPAWCLVKTFYVMLGCFCSNLCIITIWLVFFVSYLKHEPAVGCYLFFIAPCVFIRSWSGVTAACCPPVRAPTNSYLAALICYLNIFPLFCFYFCNSNISVLCKCEPIFNSDRKFDEMLHINQIV